MPIALFRHRRLYVPMRFRGSEDPKEAQRRIRSFGRVFHSGTTEMNADLLEYSTTFPSPLYVKETRLIDQISKLTITNTGYAFLNTQEQYAETGKRIGGPVASIIAPLETLMVVSSEHHEEVEAMIEEGISSRCIIELYLHKYAAGPMDYVIYRNDYGPDMVEPVRQKYAVRPYEEALEASKTDQTESADEWMKIFMGEEQPTKES